MNNKHPTQVVLAHWSQNKFQLTAIRTQVFIQEQQVSEQDEWDGLDEQAIHFLALDEQQQAIGCARLLLEPCPLEPHHTSNNRPELQWHIGRVAVVMHKRGQGIGTQIMEAAINYCQSKNPDLSIYLAAQLDKQGFYRNLGFGTEGNEFMDAGIPHIAMRLLK